MSQSDMRNTKARMKKLKHGDYHFIVNGFVRGIFNKPWYKRVHIAFSIIFKRKLR